MYQVLFCVKKVFTLNLGRLLSLHSSSQLLSCNQLIGFLKGLSKLIPLVRKNNHSSVLISSDKLIAIISESNNLSLTIIYKIKINKLNKLE